VVVRLFLGGALPSTAWPSGPSSGTLSCVAAVAQQGSRELERFSDRVLSGRANLETVGPFERKISWEFGDRAGSSQTVVSRSGLTLSISRVRWEHGFTLAFDPDPSKLKFIVARGPGPSVTPSGGQTHELASGMAQISRIQRQVDLRFDFAEATSSQEHEQLCLEIGREALCQLAGSHELPALLKNVWTSSQSFPVVTLSAPATSFRLLDELTNCDARGMARQLYLEAKGIELLAAWVDHLDEEREAGSSLCVHDIERLERARRILISRLTAPPRLPELARLAGLNEAKLKHGFRTHFGETVYGMLRRLRLNEAHRLLRAGRYNVTEVALRSSRRPFGCSLA
jgi:AraC-like DNA-binding protein